MTSSRLARSLVVSTGLLGLALVTSACAVRIGDDDGPLVSESYDIDSFDELKVDGSWDVVVTSGSETSLEVEVAEDLLNDVDINSDGGRLSISMDLGWFRSHGGRRIARVTTPNLTKVTADGATEVEVDGFQLDRLEIELDGASSIDFDELDVQELAADLNGASSINGTGTVVRLDVTVDGASSVDFDRINIDEAEVSASGASSLNLESADSVSGSLSGASSLDVADSTSVDVRTSGASSVD